MAGSAVGARSGATSLAIVVLGASAGGLEALKAFFENTPRDTGLAFLVVTHGRAGRASVMPELLARHTEMPVCLAEDGAHLEPDKVYFAPLGVRVGVLGMKLEHMGPATTGELPLLIDHLFRSVAADVGERAVAIVLSGTGSDGTLGALAIKEAGGLVIAEDPDASEYDGMPRSAIQSGAVDVVLEPRQMGAQLVAWVEGRRVLSDGVVEGLGEALGKILVLIRDRTGHDFSPYKDRTVSRRIQRRMQVHQVSTAQDYLRFLRDHPHEVDLLFRELLIGVTSFFRDPECFESLARCLAERLLAAPEQSAFRVWVAGCSTGEEAYSLMMVLRECLDEFERHVDLQIFATDIDPHAIEVARSGLYPHGIAADMSPARLQRFFTLEEGGYRVRRVIREPLVFAAQNMLTDPPFTRLDLLSCRNVLIYLESAQQARVMPLFHYALRAQGLLFLGTSETVGTGSDLFEAIDKRSRIYRRLENEGRARVSLPSLQGGGRLAGSGIRKARVASEAVQLGSDAERLLADRFVPPSVLANEAGEILHFWGRTGRFLEPAPGQPNLNLLQMASPGLRITLAAALHQIKSSDKDETHMLARQDRDQGTQEVEIVVSRVRHPEALRGLLLVSFIERALVPPDQATDVKGPVPSRIEELEEALRFSGESLQSTIEELETTTEELKCTNEELQSANEELQSTNEELETSKEEMQSLNEELRTVNAQLQGRIDRLSEVNNDMNNLLNSTAIATLFLSNDLKIKRFTPQATRILPLIDSDVGRPVGDLASQIGYGALTDDAARVQRTLESAQIELQAPSGPWYQIAILPYRTTDNVHDGLVVTFVDITPSKQAEAYADAIVEDLPLPVAVLDRDLRVTTANAEWARLWGLSSSGLIGASFAPQLRRAHPPLHELLERVLATSEAVESMELPSINGSPGGLTLRANHMATAPGDNRPHVMLVAIPSEAR